MASKLEKRFTLVWSSIRGPKLEEEFRFHPVRKWRADFVHHDTMTLIEIEGGRFGGRHVRPEGFAADAEKYLEATLLGYRVVRLCDKQLNPDTLGRVARWIEDCADQAGILEHL